MTNQAFFLSNQIALIGWILLILRPRWRLATHLICPVLIPVILGLLYFGLVIGYFPQSDGEYGSLDAVARLFESRQLLLAGWVHYLAFDLFIGAWQVRDA